MPDPAKLSKRERQIMDVVYAHREATISQVLAGMPDPPMRARCGRCCGSWSRRGTSRGDRRVAV